MTEIVRLLIEGVHMKAAAYKLGVEPSSLQQRLRNARRRAKAATNEQLVAISIRNGWIE